MEEIIPVTWISSCQISHIRISVRCACASDTAAVTVASQCVISECVCVSNAAIRGAKSFLLISALGGNGWLRLRRLTHSARCQILPGAVSEACKSDADEVH